MASLSSHNPSQRCQMRQTEKSQGLKQPQRQALVTCRSRHSGRARGTWHRGRYHMTGRRKQPSVRPPSHRAIGRLPRGRGRKCTGGSSPWRVSIAADRMEARLLGPPAGSARCPRGSTRHQINTQTGRKVTLRNQEHAAPRHMVGPKRNSPVSQICFLEEKKKTTQKKYTMFSM